MQTSIKRRFVFIFLVEDRAHSFLREHAKSYFLVLLYLRQNHLPIYGPKTGGGTQWKLRPTRAFPNGNLGTRVREGPKPPTQTALP